MWANLKFSNFSKQSGVVCQVALPARPVSIPSGHLDARRALQPDLLDPLFLIPIQPSRREPVEPRNQADGPRPGARGLAVRSTIPVAGLPFSWRTQVPSSDRFGA